MKELITIWKNKNCLETTTMSSNHKKRSTSPAVIEFAENTTTTYNKKNIAVRVYIDLCDRFDTICLVFPPKKVRHIYLKVL